MRRSGVVVFLAAVLALVSYARAAQPCQYAFVVDPCEKRVLILPTGNFNGAFLVPLNEGPAADFEPRGVALASAPDWDEVSAFVSQGPYLHVVHYSTANADATIPVADTIDLAAELPPEIPVIELTGLYAADPIELNGETHHSLYAVGTSQGTIPEPWVLILDQDVLLDWPLDPGPLLLAAGPLGEGGGSAIDVAVGATTGGGHEQEAFVSVLSQAGNDLVQRFYRLTVADGVDLGISLEPWNEEGVPFAGGEPGSLGLDLDSLGMEARGAFQTSSVVSDLGNGADSCDLAGDPTDVAIWGPGSWGGYVHFATVSGGADAGTLLGYTEDVCPYSGYDPLEVAPGALGMALSPRPLSLALSSDTSGSPWVYTASASGEVVGVQVSIVEDPAGATIEVLAQDSLVTAGCPSAIVFRDPAYEACVVGKVGDPRPTPDPDPDDDCATPKICKVNPTDPQCLLHLCKNVAFD